MKRFFHLLLGAMAMLAVALASAFLAMRLAIHGREVEVPNLAGRTMSEASDQARALGVSLHLENKFYSTDSPAGHILGQFPAAGARVRRGWDIRVTESLGPQKVSIPDVIGQFERPASLAIRRLSLDVGTVAAIPAPGDAGVVLAQTPTPNAEGVDRPRVSLLLSESERSASQAFVMPQITGLSLASAFARTNAAGLRIVSAEDATPAPATPDIASPAPAAPAASSTGYQESFPVHPAAPASASSSGAAMVMGQSPQAGHRVVRGEAVHITLSHSGS